MKSLPNSIGRIFRNWLFYLHYRSQNNFWGLASLRLLGANTSLGSVLTLALALTRPRNCFKHIAYYMSTKFQELCFPFLSLVWSRAQSCNEKCNRNICQVTNIIKKIVVCMQQTEFGYDFITAYIIDIYFVSFTKCFNLSSIKLFHWPLFSLSIRS